MRIHDREFEIYLTRQQIEKRVGDLAKAISVDFDGGNMVVLAVLNGAFIFASDLIRRLRPEPEVTFVKLKSYNGLATTGKVQTLIGLMHDLKGKHVLIVEDIVDTGLTMKELLNMVWDQEPASVKICTLLVKSTVFQDKYPLDYVGFSIPDKFVVGYGLDFDEKGRHLPDIYQVKD